MALLVSIVFLGVFVFAALLMVATKGGSSQKASQAATQSLSAQVKVDAVETAVDFRKSEVLSGIPWMNRWLHTLELAPRLRLLVYQADLKWTTGRLILTCLACFIVPTSLVSLRTGRVFLALGVGLLVSLAPFWFVFFMRTRRFAKFEKELPEALDLMVGALRAGHGLTASLGLVSRECQEPLRSEFRICFEEQNYGLELRNAIENLNTRVPSRDLAIATTAILVQKETGGNLAEVLSKTSEVIRERFRLKRQVAVHTAHGRMTGWVISLLPVALLIILYVLNPDLESLLWKRDIGVKLLYGAGAMMTIGGLIIRRIVRMEV